MTIEDQIWQAGFACVSSTIPKYRNTSNSGRAVEKNKQNQQMNELIPATLEWNGEVSSIPLTQAAIAKSTQIFNSIENCEYNSRRFRLNLNSFVCDWKSEYLRSQYLHSRLIEGSLLRRRMNIDLWIAFVYSMPFSHQHWIYIVYCLRVRTHWKTLYANRSETACNSFFNLSNWEISVRQLSDRLKMWNEADSRQMNLVSVCCMAFAKVMCTQANSIFPADMQKFMNIEQLLVSLGSKAQTTFRTLLLLEKSIYWWSSMCT